MNWKTWLLLILALVAGVFGSYAVRTAFFDDKGAQVVDDSSTAGPKERLLVANGFLAAGKEIDATNVRLVLTPEKDVPRDGIFSFSEFVGRKVTRDYQDGEPISLYDVEALEEHQQVETVFVPPGYSVVPIEISSASKANGSRNYLKTARLEEFVKPGDLVDVIVVKEDFDNSSANQRRRLTSTTIVSGAPVFSIDDTSRLSADGVVRSSVLSALLNSDELELVRKASEEGKIRIVLSDQPSESEVLELSSELNLSDVVSQRSNDFAVPEKSEKSEPAAPPAEKAVEEPTDNAASIMATPSLNNNFVVADELAGKVASPSADNTVLLDVVDSSPDMRQPQMSTVADSDESDFASVPEEKASQLELGSSEQEISEQESPFRARVRQDAANPSTEDGSFAGDAAAPDDLAMNATVRGNVSDENPRGSFKLSSPFVTRGEGGPKRTNSRKPEDKK